MHDTVTVSCKDYFRQETNQVTNQNLSQKLQLHMRLSLCDLGILSQTYLLGQKLNETALKKHVF